MESGERQGSGEVHEDAVAELLVRIGQRLPRSSRPLDPILAMWRSFHASVVADEAVRLVSLRQAFGEHEVGPDRVGGQVAQSREGGMAEPPVPEGDGVGRARQLNRAVRVGAACGYRAEGEPSGSRVVELVASAFFDKRYNPFGESDGARVPKLH